MPEVIDLEPSGIMDAAVVSSEKVVVIAAAAAEDREGGSCWSNTGTGEDEGRLTGSAQHSRIDVKVPSSLSSDFVHFTD